MKSIRNWQVLLASLLVLSIPFITIGVQAQMGTGAKITYISDEKFPLVQAYISVSDAQGLPVKGLTADNFTVSEDDRPIENFNVSAVQNTQQPLAMVLLIDTSGSMGYGTPKTALQQSVAAAKTFINTLAPQDAVALVSFSDAPALVQDFTTDHALLGGGLDTLVPGKNTAMYDAIVKAATMLSNRGERRIIVLLTDGYDSGTGFTFDQAISEAQKWGVPIYPIGFGGIDKNSLQNIASMTGGSVQVQPGPSTLTNAFSAVLQILREQYLLEFNSALPADAGEHNLVVAVDFQGWHEELSHRFIAQAGELTVTLPGFQDGQTIGGYITFAPRWTTPAPAIQQVDISMDGANLASLTAAPFEFKWDSTTTSPGSHAFTFVVKDTAGNTGQLEMSLLVQPPVTLAISQPAEGATISGKSPISAEVTALGTIATVSFTVDGQEIGSVTTPPYEFEWDPSSFPAGKHVISVTAVDADGFSANAQATVNVSIKHGSGIFWIALIMVLAVAGILIPLSLRKRKRIGHDSRTPTPQKGQAVLLEEEGLNPGRTWTLGAGDVRLGRKQDENDIPLKGLKASRRHAVIHFQEGEYVIESLSPENPLIVNEQTTQKHTLCSGDVIRLGDTRLRFE